MSHLDWMLSRFKFAGLSNPLLICTLLTKHEGCILVGLCHVFSTDMKWNDSIKSLASSAARYFGYRCRV